MARRATLLRAIKDTDDILILDAGGFNAGQGKWNSLKSKYLLRSLAYMNYTAINLGYQDLAHGSKYLKDLEKSLNITFISANIFKSGSNKHFTKPYVIEKMKLKKADGKTETVRVGIFGVTQEYNLNWLGAEGLNDFEIREPVEESKKIIKKLNKKCDYIIALTFMNGDLAKELITNVEGIDIVIMGKAGYRYTKPVTENGVLFLPGGRQGKDQKKTSITLEKNEGVKDYKHKNINLTDEIEDDSNVEKLVKEYKQKLVELQNSFRETVRTAPE